jgi:long-chain acyl-CoA synthetase
MESKPQSYGKYLSKEKLPGESKILRNINLPEDSDHCKLFKGTMSTLKEVVIHNLNECPDKLFMGTRVPITGDAGNSFGEYQWKTFKQTYNESLAISKYLYNENLVPTITNEEGTFRFLGLYSKNREEWVTTDISCMLSAVTSVPLYDTLGKESMEYILD